MHIRFTFFVLAVLIAANPLVSFSVLAEDVEAIPSLIPVDERNDQDTKAVSDIKVVPLPPLKPDFQGVLIAWNNERIVDVNSENVEHYPKSKPMTSGDLPLSEADAKLYQDIFNAQQAGKFTQANKLINQLSDFRLRGHVMYQRYMHAHYRTSFEELRSWLDLYSDYPGADKIQKLANRRMPGDFQGEIRAAQISNGVGLKRDPSVEKGKTYRSLNKRSKSQSQQIRGLQRAVMKYLARTSPTRALNKLNNDPAAQYMDDAEKDIMLSHIAMSYLHAGKVEKAKEIATQASIRSPYYAPLAGWVAGLISWRDQDYIGAAKFFEAAALSEYTSGWTVSASAFWAARSNMRTGNVRSVSKWLERAAEHPRTFYGLIATRSLGRDFDFNWVLPKAKANVDELIHRHPSGVRANLLIQAKQFDRAKFEMMRIHPGKDQDMGEALLTYAATSGLPALALRLGSALKDEDGRLYDSVLYPDSPWHPSYDYKVDPSLINAIIRQESRFNPLAESPSGATGLMQLMPATAKHVQKRMKTKHVDLSDPESNITIGQAYLEELLNNKHVDGDLFSMAIAYNAGPGNLRRWKNSLPGKKDSLLFVESIPVAETRAYVERVMSSYWIYRMKNGLPTPSLDAAAEGRIAKYAAIPEEYSIRLAEHSE